MADLIAVMYLDEYRAAEVLPVLSRTRAQSASCSLG